MGDALSCADFQGIALFLQTRTPQYGVVSLRSGIVCLPTWGPTVERALISLLDKCPRKGTETERFIDP